MKKKKFNIYEKDLKRSCCSLLSNQFGELKGLVKDDNLSKYNHKNLQE